MVSGISPGRAAQAGPGMAGVGERLDLGHHRQGWWEADCCPASVLGVESSFSSCPGFKSQPFQGAWEKVTEPVPSYPACEVELELPCDEHTRHGRAVTADDEGLGPHVGL